MTSRPISDDRPAVRVFNVERWQKRIDAGPDSHRFAGRRGIEFPAVPVRESVRIGGGRNVSRSS
jgi:hypothetical protein